MRLQIVAIVLLLLSFSMSSANDKCENYFKYEFGISKYDTTHLKTIGRYETTDGHILYYEEVSKPDVLLESKRIDPHGFISNLRYVFGEDSANYWGADQIGKYYSFPDVDFLNRRISKLNAILSPRKTIPVQFRIDPSAQYGDSTKQLVTPLNYVQTHSQGIVLIAESGWSRKHDENYHVGANLVLPRRIQLEAFKKSQIIIEFRKYFEERGLLTPDRNSFFDSLLALRAFQIDMSGNAFVSLIFAKAKKSDLKNEYLSTMAQLKNVLSDYTQSFLTAEEYMLSQIEVYSQGQPIKSRFLMRAFYHFMALSENAKLYRSAPLYLAEEELSELTFQNYEAIKKESEFLFVLQPPLPELHL